MKIPCYLSSLWVVCLLPIALRADPVEGGPLPRAWIDAQAAGWRDLTASDFENVNCAPDTWKWDGPVLRCSGKPIGVMASKMEFTNFEMIAEWRHLKHAGNSGIFVWASLESLNELRAGKGQLPAGIEVQILDPGFEADYEKKHGKKADWFTSHGDVFPVRAKMTPFPPVSANGQRSFPTRRLTRGVGEWNHYYIRCINGEVRLWVNGEEVSGGTQCDPSSGFLCLESEGSSIEFRNLRIRELP